MSKTDETKRFIWNMNVEPVHSAEGSALIVRATDEAGTVEIAVAILHNGPPAGFTAVEAERRMYAALTAAETTVGRSLGAERVNVCSVFGEAGRPN